MWTERRGMSQFTAVFILLSIAKTRDRCIREMLYFMTTHVLLHQSDKIVQLSVDVTYRRKCIPLATDASLAR